MAADAPKIDIGQPTAITLEPGSFTLLGTRSHQQLLVTGQYPNNEVRVYNRWGQLVFETDTPTLGWDGRFEGTDSPTGIYIYQVVFKGYNLKEIRKTGTVMLIR